MKVCLHSDALDDSDFSALHTHGFSDEGIWGHRRHYGFLQVVQPHGQHDRYAAQPRVLPALVASPRNAGVARRFAPATRVSDRFRHF